MKWFQKYFLDHFSQSLLIKINILDTDSNLRVKWWLNNSHSVWICEKNQILGFLTKSFCIY